MQTNLKEMELCWTKDIITHAQNLMVHIYVFQKLTEFKQNNKKRYK